MQQQHTFSLFERLIADYDHRLSHSAVSGERLAQRLHELAQIGLTEQMGSQRIGFTPEEKAAKELVKGWMREAGLEVIDDGAGNVFGRLAGQHPEKPAIMAGSHVDSVPNGGHFDGPLGVLVALEVAQAWQESGFQPACPYEVAIFTDEEGARFNGGFTGSKALVGDLDLDKQRSLVDADGLGFEEVMQHAGLSMEGLQQAKRDVADIKAFIEVHIEQGKQLEKEELPVGIVTGIAGPCWVNMTFKGQAGHAGNTPMNDRQDALVAASAFILALKQLPARISSSAVATVGKLHVFPNGVNVIPGEVQLTVDLRDIHASTRDQLVEQTIELAQKLAHGHGVEFTCEETLRIDPVPIPQQMQDILADALQAQEPAIRPYFLPSGAGHDTMILGRHVPVAMLFVRSVEGISHNPKEWTSLNDCVVSAHVLRSVVERLML